MATPPKKSLGRGLGNLIGGGVAKPAAPAPAPAPVAAQPVAPAPAPAPVSLVPAELPVSVIIPNPHQPRKEFDDVAVKELAESIRSEGLLQPIVVRKVKAGYELIAGERRLRAFKSLGQKSIPVRIIEASDASSAVLAMIENLQRADLNPVEEALGVASLMRDFNLTQEAVADLISLAYLKTICWKQASCSITLLIVFLQHLHCSKNDAQLRRQMQLGNKIYACSTMFHTIKKWFFLVEVVQMER
jgi:ParB family chromosome partitioning protein